MAVRSKGIEYMAGQPFLRPVGISVLSGLHIVAGILGAISAVLLANQFRNNLEGREAASAMGIPPSLYVLSVVFLVALALVSGIGMLTGKKWGWHLGSFAYLYTVLLNLNALLTLPTLFSSLSAEEIAQLSRNPQYYYVKYSVRLVMSFLIYRYFFKGNVRAFFDLSEQKRWKPVLVQIGVCIGVTAIVNVLALAVH